MLIVLKAKAAMVFKPNPAFDQRFEHFKVSLIHFLFQYTMITICSCIKHL